MNRYPQEICEGKGQHTYVWAIFACHRPVYSTSLQQQESQTYSYIVEVYGSTGTISHFGERFRSGLYTLEISCLPHVVLRAQLSVKVGARPRALWFRTYCLGHGPSLMVWGQVI